MDAACAVAALGLLPSVAMATHLVVEWEYEDLHIALGSTGGPVPTGLVVLDASLDEHNVRWHPYLLNIGPDRGDGFPTVVPEWGEPAHHPGGWLPAPVAELLAVWREWRSGDIAETRAQLAAAGFTVTWTEDER